VSTWLAGYSLLYAYFGNLALIIVAIASDEFAFKIYESAMQSKKYLAQLEKDWFFNFFLDSFISFKAILYLFYIFVLVTSQVVGFTSTSLNSNLENFIIANRYSILLLIAADQLFGQFSKDKKRIRKLSVKFRKHLAENQDE